MSGVVASAHKAQVPFRLAGGAQPLILVPVSINDQGPFEFILDTGAGTTLLTPELAGRLNITPTGSKQGHTAGGAIQVKLSTADAVALGDITREKVDVAITDLNQVGRAVGARIDGDLGHNFFGAFRLTIDYRQSLLRLDDPKRSEYCGAPPLTELPARLAHPAKPLILIEAHVNGRGPFCFAVDTGTSTTTIAIEIARELGLQTAAAGSITTGSAPISIHAAQLDTLRAGACEIVNFNVIVGGFLPILSDVIGARLDGIIGYDFLRNYKVVIDYPNSAFSLFRA